MFVQIYLCIPTCAEPHGERIARPSFIIFKLSIPLAILAAHPYAHCKQDMKLTELHLLPEVLLIMHSDKLLRTMNTYINITFTYYYSVINNAQLFLKCRAIHHKR